MNTIGYAILKKTSNLVIDSNGLFDDLQLADDFNFIINTLISLKEEGQKLLCFKRIGSKLGSQDTKDTYLVILLERVKKNNQNFVLGSAICFREYDVNEDKIINGVQYLLSQLKRNLENDYNIEDKDLGVILPSTNKDFKIFKDTKLIYNQVRSYVNGYNKISFSNSDAESYLHQFCTHKTLFNTEHLLLVSSDSMFNELSQKDNGFIKISHQTLINPKEEVKKSTILTSSSDEIDVIKNELNVATEERDKEKKDKDLYKILSIILFCAIIFLVLMFAVNRPNKTFEEVADSSIYPIEDNLYISNNTYNVNIRSSPTFSVEKDNLKAILSDGDEVFLLGFDKETLWAKISYNDGNEIGYVSNRFISKNIDVKRIEPINKKGYITRSNDIVPLYAFPQETANENPEKIQIFLDENDKIFVKNKDLKMNWFSVRLKKNNKIYNGFLQRNDFEYQ